MGFLWVCKMSWFRVCKSDVEFLVEIGGDGFV